MKTFNRSIFSLPALILCLFFAFSGFSLYAEEEPEFIEETPKSRVIFEFKEFNPFTPYMQMAVGLRFDPEAELDTVLWSVLGGGYYNSAYWRNPDGSVFQPATDLEIERVLYRTGVFDYALGISQGLMYHDEYPMNSLEVFLWYRGILKGHQEDKSPAGSLIFDSGLPDANGIWQNSLMAGLYLFTVKYDYLLQSRKGMIGQAVYEYSPSWLANNILGQSDFSRVDLMLINYIPLITSHAVTMYLGQLAAFDLLWGDSIPIHARQNFGGRITSLGMGGLPGTGGLLRGLDSYKYDGYLKLLHCLDLRIFFPDLIDYAIMPGLMVFFDIGAYDDLTYSITSDRIFYSTGGGVILHLDSIILIPASLRADLMIVGNYSFNENRFSPSLRLNLHY